VGGRTTVKKISGGAHLGRRNMKKNGLKTRKRDPKKRTLKGKPLKGKLGRPFEKRWGKSRRRTDEEARGTQAGRKT